MLKNGYVKLYRSMLNWEWYKNSNTKSLFLHCLLKANFTDAKFENEVIKRGEFVTSFKKLSEETGMSINEIRTALKHLNLTQVLTHRSNCQYTVITVLNFDKYQDLTHERTNDSQTINKRLTNDSQQYKKNKKNKNIYNNTSTLVSSSNTASASLSVSEPCGNDDWLTRDMTEEEFEALPLEQKRARIAYFRKNG